MSTTTKTLTPTNQTITLPDMTERPNASVLVDGIGKEADAINALSDQMAKKCNVITFFYETAGTYTYTFSTQTALAVFVDRINTTANGYNGLYIGYAHTNGNIKPVMAADGTTVSISGMTLTITTTVTNMSVRILTFDREFSAS